jgi:hypothetical protein
MIFFLILNFNLYAAEMRVLEVDGALPIFVKRTNSKIKVDTGLSLMVNDTLETLDSQVLLLINSSIQLSLAKKSKLKLSSPQFVDSQKSSNVVTCEMIQGMWKIRINKSQKPQEIYLVLPHVQLILTEGEYAISVKSQGDSTLEVLSGQATASSDLIHSFVPEIITTGHGLDFVLLKKKFFNRKLIKSSYNFLPFRDQRFLSPTKKLKNDKKENVKNPKDVKFLKHQLKS